MTKAAASVLALASLITSYGGGAPAALAQGPTPAPPATSARVKLTLTIMDRLGRYVEGLSKDQITLTEGKSPREIASFEPSAEPMSVGVVFDMSARNRARLLASAKVALANFVGAGAGGSRYFVIGFDREPYLAADWAASAEAVAAGFDRLAAVKPADGAALYDAVNAALLKVAEGPHPKRAVILISDGRNDGSKAKRGEMLEAARRSDALIYALAVKPTGVPQPDSSDQTTLDELCSTTGGFASTAYYGAQFQEFFERLSVELRHQYSISFVPAGAGADGEWRRLGFRAKPLELKRSPSARGAERVELSVRAREGYYYHR